MIGIVYERRKQTDNPDSFCVGCWAFVSRNKTSTHQILGMSYHHFIIVGHTLLTKSQYAVDRRCLDVPENATLQSTELFVKQKIQERILELATLHKHIDLDNGS